MPGRPHRAPHHLMRYAPILRAARALPPGARVLEVGSGVEGLGTWWRGPFVGVDLAFEGRRSPALRPVRGDAVRLPFRDGAFDLVACPGVLHFLEGDLDAALREIGRVTRGAAIAVVPCGREARSSDLRTREWLLRRGIPAPRWFREQLERGLPDCGRIRAGLAPFGRVREGATLSVPWHERIFRIEQRLRRVPGAMTALQPLLRASGRALARELPRGGPPYERWFLLETQATDSPPRRASSWAIRQTRKGRRLRSGSWLR